MDSAQKDCYFSYTNLQFLVLHLSDTDIFILCVEMLCVYIIDIDKCIYNTMNVWLTR
jgi:hypothetical protein